LCVAAKADDTPDTGQFIDTFEKLGGGPQKGLRRNHTKGTCVVGSFVGTAAAKKLSSSALFSGEAVPVIGRFSHPTPGAKEPDSTNNPRGFALQFHLPKDELQQTSMINVPVFLAATPKTFFDFAQALLPDPATGKDDPEKFKAFVGSHPDFKPFLDYVSTHNAPPSYVNTTYFSIHAYKFINGKKETWVKWRFEPADGDKQMTAEELAKAPADFLEKKLTERTRKGPVKFTMIVTLGEKGDPVDNPTLAWPAGRKEIKAGVLTLTKGGTDAKGQCEEVNFDPNVVSDGIETSPDPVLQYRSQAYAESYSRRASEK